MRSVLFCAIFICLGIVNSYGHIIERSREIELHNAKVDTRSAPLFHIDEAHLARSRLFSEEQEHQYLIHVGKSLTQEEKNSLEAYLGFTLENYIPHNTYLVVCDKKTAMDALYAPNVQWVGDFAPEYKIPVHLLEEIVDNKLLVTLSPKERSFSDVQRVAFIWKDSIEGVTEVKAVSNSQIGITFEKKKDAERIVNWIAQRPESHFIEAARKYEPYNYYASQVIQSNSNPSVPFPFTNNMGFNGNNDLVGVADSGLRYSSCYFNTTTVSSSTINNNAKVVLYNTTYSGGDMTDATGHGTAVTGTITGINGGDKADGITPNTRIFFMDIQAAASSAPLSPPANLGDLFNPAFQAGANLFVAAFGAPANSYGTDAASIDKYCYTNQQFLPIVPAGNSDSTGANRTLSSLAQSKNALVVGASYTSNEGLYDNAQGASEALKYISSPALYGSHVLASISSRGPTVDGRIKPDIVAPGQTIITADSTSTCGSKQVTGTSYAAGVAASAAVIVRNYFEQAYYPSGAPDPGNAQYQSPSASLVKAVLINSGAALLSTDANQKGDYVGLGPIPSGYQGYGRIQLDSTLFTNAVKRDPNQAFYAYASVAESLSTGNSIRYCFEPTGTPSRIKATLVWADKDASPAAGHILVNDLDLVGMDLSGIMYRSQTANGGFDTFNNVEQVEVSGLGPTAFHVHARSVPVGPQSYAVVFSGTNFQSTFCPTDFDAGNRVCPGQCSGVGNCTDQGYCTCPAGRQGLDCSLSPCPTVGGYICAGNGYCDYSSSTCVCGGLYAQPDCASLQPQAPPTNTNSTTFIVATKDTGISAGLLAGTVIAAFFVGAIFSIFLGGYIAVRYLEYRRDKIQKDRATKDEEMH